MCSDEYDLNWLRMIRRFWIAFYAFALVFLAVGFLTLALFCLFDIVLTHDLPWPFLLPVFGLAWLLWITWRLLKREIASGNGHDEGTAKSLSSAQLPGGGRNRARVRKIPGFDPICRFVRWFWRIGGLDDVKSPLWLTPFGGWFMVFLSSPILISALVIFIRTEVFLHRSVSADGTVIRLVADHEETVHYAPVFAFTAQNGRAITIQSTTYSVPPEFSVGQKVPILYEKDHPEHARIATYGQVHSFEDVSGIIGLSFAGIGFGSLIYQRKRNRRTTGSKVAR
jgi:hypothetical protein